LIDPNKMSTWHNGFYGNQKMRN